ncbi:hypothetical protein TorRG33x02_229280, partial [Trema orientale]
VRGLDRLYGWDHNILGSTLPRTLSWCRSSSVHSSLDLALDNPSLFYCRPYVYFLLGFIYLDKFLDSSLEFYSTGDEDLLGDVSKEWVIPCFPKLLCNLSDRQPKSWSLAFILYHPYRAMRQLGFGKNWPHDFRFAFLEPMIGMFPLIPLTEFLRNPLYIPFPLNFGDGSVSAVFTHNWHNLMESLLDP